MAYFVRVGSMSKNKGGVGARGYQLFRRGSVVITRWGLEKFIAFMDANGKMKEK